MNIRHTLRQHSKEAEGRNIDLVDTSTETSELAMKWLYTRVFDPASVDKKITILNR